MSEPEFRPHAAIEELAKIEWECPGHDDTGRIVPFAPLRVEKQGVWSHRDCIALGRCDMVLTDGSMLIGTTDCKGRGWVPKSDLRVAYWEIGQVVDKVGRQLWYNKLDKTWVWLEHLPDGAVREHAEVEKGKAVLLAAKAWAKEQHE